METKAVTLRLPEPTYNAIADLAKSQKRSIKAQIEFFLENNVHQWCSERTNANETNPTGNR